MEMIGGASGPSMRMVAEAANVSVATVSNVLNDKPSVSPEIAKRVRDAIASLGYVRDNRAARLRSGQSRLAGVIVPDLTNPMFASFVSTLEHLARLDHYDLVVVSSRNDPAEEAERLEKIREWRPGGLIVLPCDGSLADRMPRAPGMPVVVADRIPDSPIFDLVAVDNGDASASVTRHLASQGAQNCIVVGTSLRISNVFERWQGAQAGAGTMGLTLVEVGFEDHAPPELARMLREQPRPDAVFCLDHETTLAVYRMIGEIGLRPGRDLALASFDEMEWMRLVAPAITAVRQPIEDMANCAWATLRRRMAGDQGPLESRRLSCAVTFRGSTPRQSASEEAIICKDGGKQP